MKLSLFLCLLVFTGRLAAQTPDNSYLSLHPYQVHGHDNPLKFNVNFGSYKTKNIRRSLGSLFNFGHFSVENMILDMAGVPFRLYDGDKNKDVFRFELKQGDSLLSNVRCKAVLHTREYIGFPGRADSSFWGAANTDILQAVILLYNDTGRLWQMAGFNLNGSKNEPQRGVLQHDTTVINFVKTTLLLREKEVNRNDVSSLLATLNMVYSFSWHNRIIGAVSFKEAEKKIWIDENLPTNIAHAIATAATVLTLRRQLYK